MKKTLMILAATLSLAILHSAEASELSRRFDEAVRPFLRDYCLDCHGKELQEAKLDLSGYTSAKLVAEAHPTWEIVLQRLQAGEMPPDHADPQPTESQRQAVVEWIQSARQFEARQNAGDPGPVLPRRLSNAEYNYSIRDLTGVDIRPTDTFPVDPANEAGFDNSGESLAMSPALLKKQLGAARQVVEHLVLKPQGIDFAPHPAVTNTDRDKYCVKRIVEFYERQPTDLADYFFGAWRGRDGQADLNEIAADEEISAKYLETVWSLLTADEALGPICQLQTMWRELPTDDSDRQAARDGCEEMRDFIAATRQKVAPSFPNLYIKGNHKGSQPFVLWKNRQYAARRRSFDPEAAGVEENEQTPQYAAWRRFCEVFPDAFYISERGRDYLDKPRDEQEKGRLLSAGFHSMMGYFRDDAPLYDMILSGDERRELDLLWQELDFITSAPMRQYSGFLWFERTDSRFMRDPQFDFARPENKAALTEPMIEKLAEVYLDKARANGGGDVEIGAIEHYFREINEQIRWVEQARLAAEPSHIQAVLAFAERAYRRKLHENERGELVGFYRSLREDDDLSHEEAIQDTIVSILMSPYFSYRVDMAGDGPDRRPLTGEELASRLSYFLWASVPDEPLREAAEAGELLRGDELVAQTRRMLQDDRMRGLATEFAAHWLDFRRFEEHNSVDRQRFPAFTDELRSAMFEEPIRFFIDLVRHDRSVLEFLHADHTFANGVLAKHYGIEPFDGDRWQRVDNAAEYGRGGVLPMAVFLTKNAPGLRTSPVKRGYWVVRRLLGEHIPPPPPNVPELPEDEADLGELTLRETLARHRDHPSCAGCHERFDSIGLVFEGFGPIGERRSKDLGGRPIDTAATLPGGAEAAGVDDLRRYLRERREDEFLDNLCRKLLSYALSRSLILSDELLVQQMRKSLKSEGYRFGSLVETIVSSPQFLKKRTRDTTSSKP